MAVPAVDETLRAPSLVFVGVWIRLLGPKVGSHPQISCWREGYSSKVLPAHLLLSTNSIPPLLCDVLIADFLKNAPVLE